MGFIWIWDKVGNRNIVHMNTYCHASLATTKKDNCEETLDQNPLCSGLCNLLHSHVTPIFHKLDANMF
jgi:hypothetical protein